MQFLTEGLIIYEIINIQYNKRYFVAEKQMKTEIFCFLNGISYLGHTILWQKF